MITARGNGAGHRSRRRTVIWAAPIAALVIVAIVIGARWLLHSGAGQSFVASYPGESPPRSDTPHGFPWWVQWQHAANFIFIVLIIRSGWLVHVQQRPEAFWTRKNTGRWKSKKPPTKMSLYLWLHLSMDALWVLNGVVFGVLLLITGHWARIVPGDWDIFPNAASAALQYAAFDWPLNRPWTNYNSLQVLAYFVTIFVAAPVAALTGIRLSPAWPARWKINRLYPLPLARAIHLPVMFYFVVFIVTHVTLVFATGVRLNLNAMYGGQGPGSGSWWGLLIFLGVLLIAVFGWIAARPIFMQPVASRTGRVSAR